MTSMTSTFKPIIWMWALFLRLFRTETTPAQITAPVPDTATDQRPETTTEELSISPTPPKTAKSALKSGTAVVRKSNADGSPNTVLFATKKGGALVGKVIALEGGVALISRWNGPPFRRTLVSAAGD
jgi:hypothetical protein